MVKKIILTISLIQLTFFGFAQTTKKENVLSYINTYKDLAVKEQQRSGVPAAITLAQGILETDAGSSELCLNAYNHFGIKCKSTWTGETYTYTDDAKDECFRKYSAAHHSYIDHSDFLKNNKRYSNLFSLEPTDYKAWAHGLKKCGYATNPAYALRLIKFIETYQLQDYTHLALNTTIETPTVLLASTERVPAAALAHQTKTEKKQIVSEVIPENEGYEHDAALAALETKAIAPQNNSGNVTEYYTLTTRHGLKGFYAKKGDMLLEYAIKNKVRYAKLLELNDLPDAPLETDMFVYLVKKHKTGQAPTHKVENGESLVQISQIQAIQMEQLLLLNHLKEGEIPVAGSIIHLQTAAANKPQIYTKLQKETNGVNKATVQNQNSAYIAGGKKNNPTEEYKNTSTRVVTIKDETEPTIVKQTEQPKAITTAPQKTNNIEKVNIANEPAIEETLTAQRNNQKQIATVPTQQKAPVQSETNNTPKEPLSALDKLKAHMDKAVYGQQQTDFEPKTSKTYTPETTSSTSNTAESNNTTLPARNNTANNNTTTNNKPAKQSERITPAAKAKPTVHTVKRGETLFGIADKYDLTVSQLQKLNKLGSKQIQPGMKLKLK